jgi:hypothetical protein
MPSRFVCGQEGQLRCVAKDSNCTTQFTLLRFQVMDVVQKEKHQQETLLKKWSSQRKENSIYNQRGKRRRTSLLVISHHHPLPDYWHALGNASYYGNYEVFGSLVVLWTGTRFSWEQRLNEWAYILRSQRPLLPHSCKLPTSNKN